MDVLFTILKVAVVTVLASSLLEALVLSLRHGWRSYDWKASAVSVVDFLIREYPLRFLLPLVFWTDAMGWFWQHRLWTLPMDHWTGWAACFVGSEFCYYWYHRAAHRADAAVAQPAVPVLDPRHLDPAPGSARVDPQHAVRASRPSRRQPRIP